MHQIQPFQLPWQTRHNKSFQKEAAPTLFDIQYGPMHSLGAGSIHMMHILRYMLLWLYHESGTMMLVRPKLEGQARGRCRVDS